MSAIPDPAFENEIDAARYLLEESTQALTRREVNFIVVGGWPAYLFHSKPYGHPGTLDVDLLLHPNSLDDGTFDAATEDLLSAGYLRAPKNIFQAHRILRVSGEKLVFHVDFLNERDPSNPLELTSGSGRMKSIYNPGMKAIFEVERYSLLI